MQEHWMIEGIVNVTKFSTWSLKWLRDNFINVGYETHWIIDEKAPNALNLDFIGNTVNFLFMYGFLQRGHINQLVRMNSLSQKSRATRQIQRLKVNV